MNKKKYIELEAAVEILKRKSLMMFNSYYKGYTNAIKDLAEIPAADVQEVVRCKDCKYYFKSTAYNGYLCGKSVGLCDVDSDSYCSYGERKDDESNA